MNQGMYGFPPGLTTSITPVGLSLTSNMSASFSVTPSSNLYQEFGPSAANLTITVASGSAYPFTGLAHVFKNNVTNGRFPVQILDANSNLITWVMPGAYVALILESQTTAGVWRVDTGNRANDNGFFEWGVPITYQGVAALATSHFGFKGSHNLDAELGLLTDVGVASGTFNPIAYRLKDGAFQLGAALGAVTANATQTIDTCSNGAAEVLVAYGGASNPTVASLSINTATLAITSNATKTGAAVATGFVGMDAIANSNNLLTYTETTTNKAWIALITGQGAGLTYNSAVQLSATTGMKAAQVAGLSSTLAHCLAWDGSTMYLSRTTIAGTVPTPGTQSTLTNRGHVSNSFTGAMNIVKIDATHSLAAYCGINSGAASKGGSLYANVITDTGATITQNEILLVDDFSAAFPANFNNFVLAAVYKGANSTLICIFSDGSSLKMCIVRVITNSSGVLTPIVSPMFDKWLPGPYFGSTSANTGVYAFVQKCMKGPGSYVVIAPNLSALIAADLTTAGTNEAAQSFMPMCIA